jgi:hypothetical protein
MRLCLSLCALALCASGAFAADYGPAITTTDGCSYVRGSDGHYYLSSGPLPVGVSRSVAPARGSCPCDASCACPAGVCESGACPVGTKAGSSAGSVQYTQVCGPNGCRLVPTNLPAAGPVIPAAAVYPTGGTGSVSGCSSGSCSGGSCGVPQRQSRHLGWRLGW